MNLHNYFKRLLKSLNYLSCFSNTAGNDISAKAFLNWESGNAREAITRKEMEEVIQASAFNEKGEHLYILYIFI